MTYRNGKNVLPPELLRELQKYIEGELLYIPRKDEKRVGWGESNGTRSAIRERNQEIYNLYRKGTSVDKLAESYNLSEDSIRRIIVKTPKEPTGSGSVKIGTADPLPAGL